MVALLGAFMTVGAATELSRLAESLQPPPIMPAHHFSMVGQPSLPASAQLFAALRHTATKMTYAPTRVPGVLHVARKQSTWQICGLSLLMCGFKSQWPVACQPQPAGVEQPWLAYVAPAPSHLLACMSYSQ